MTAIHDFHILNNSLIAGAVLFAIGVIGFLTRESHRGKLVAAGIMFQGVLLTLAAFSRFHGNWSGQVFVLIALVVIVAEGILAWAVVSRSTDQNEPDGLTDGMRSVEPGISGRVAEHRDTGDTDVEASLAADAEGNQ